MKYKKRETKEKKEKREILELAAFDAGLLVWMSSYEDKRREIERARARERRLGIGGDR